MNLVLWRGGIISIERIFGEQSRVIKINKMGKQRILKINVDLHQNVKSYCTTICTNDCFTSNISTDLISVSCLNVKKQKINCFKEFQEHVLKCKS